MNVGRLRYLLWNVFSYLDEVVYEEAYNTELSFAIFLLSRADDPFQCMLLNFCENKSYMWAFKSLKKDRFIFKVLSKNLV